MNKRDLTKPFLTDKNEKILVSNNSMHWQERYVHSYDGKNWYCWDGGKTGEEWGYDVMCLSDWKNAKHIQEKRPFTSDDAMELLWKLNKEHCVVVRHKNWGFKYFEYFTHIVSKDSPKDFQYGFIENGEVSEWFDFKEDYE